MHYSPIKKSWLHVLHFRSIEAGPCNIVEGPAAAKGAVPPEGWGRDCEEGTTEQEGTSPYHASCCAQGFPLLGDRGQHDSSAAEGGQPGGAPWWSPDACPVNRSFSEGGQGRHDTGRTAGDNGGQKP